MSELRKKVGNQWYLSHMRFLRKGDIFKVSGRDGSCDTYEATSNPYFDKTIEDWSIGANEVTVKPTII